MANEKRLIDVNPLMKNGWHLVKTGESNVFLASMSLADVPTVDAVEVVHGRWMVSRESEISKNVWCTACGEDFYIRKKIGAVLIDKMPYCPNCGADMRDGDGNG